MVLAYVYNFISSALRLNAAAEERRVRVAEELRARQQAERERIQQEVFIVVLHCFEFEDIVVIFNLLLNSYGSGRSRRCCETSPG